MKTIKVDNVVIQCVQGDITKQPDVEAIVNAANAYLKPGGGVAGAIHRAAGPELEKECSKYAPIKVGEAVITKAYNLPNKYVIHCLGPRYGIDKPEDKLLADCYINAIKLAEENKITSIAFPAISTGIFGYPIEDATKVVLKTVFTLVKRITYLKIIRFVLFSEQDYIVYCKYLDELGGSYYEK
ncbi:MAG: macro domain-containing protein [Endomicrobia bacterium]|nr:macro domain-containing protein [Endomicrobiia bacterium]MDW8056288.1 macro domain-containing protein [Elusimicrobiota bacterium]